MSKVKYGIIGLGWFGEYHGDALAGLPNVELYALCTRTESRLKELGEKFGVKHLYTDYNEMLANGITFVRAPKTAAYGTVAVFEDLYGNRWDLIGRRP